ncbi:UPF0481 protein At3g47200-like [Neltuma alba]|uniref:UPF0481 protein At3g47200-like n=1 Tax=Neltuma alba TaxID=207710 RepID=UPI0010A45C42|nr:UPF0481 protein At3g47200-like [Prosopis alba]
MTPPDRSCNSFDRATTPSNSLFNLQSSFARLEDEKLSFKEMKAKLEEAKRTPGRGNRPWEDGQTLNAPPKIQKVQPYLRNRPDFAKYYSPKLVSIGPIHRKDTQENLKQGEHYKMIWAAMYLEDTAQSAECLFAEIRRRLPALKQLYTEDAIEDFLDKDEELAWIFLMDGCAVLRFIQQADSNCPEVDLKVKIDQLVLVQQDLLLLENQLPYELLKLLSKGGETELKEYTVKFLQRHQMTRIIGVDKPPRQAEITVDHPTHLLHLLRQYIVGDLDRNSSEDREGTGSGFPKFPTYRNIQELKAAGISVTKGNICTTLTDIRFDCAMTWKGFGRLQLPKLVVDDSTLPTFLNLIAYEMCPDFLNGYGISSYVAFLDSLIDHAGDVKDLRKEEVLHNALGSDEEVAKLFNTISTDLVPDTERYGKIRRDLEKRYDTMWMTWVAQAIHDFSKPCPFLSFVAALIALCLTSVQTWFTVHPPPSNA